MVTDFARLEVSDDGENGDNEVELSLELSIGRSNKSLKPENKKSAGSCIKMSANDRSLSRSGVPEMIIAGDTGSEGAFDLQSKREIQALRRQEARKKREEKLRKLAYKSSVNVDEKSWLEARQFEVRARERENRENEDLNFSRKREKMENVSQNSCGNEDIGDLNLALNTGSCSMAPVLPLQFLDRPFRNVGTYSDLRPCWSPTGASVPRSEEKMSVPVVSRSFRPYQGNLNSVHDDGTDNGSAGCSSSAVSDYQSSPQQGGGSSSESGKSNSNHSTKPKQQEQNLINASAPTQQSEHTDSSCSSASLIKTNQTTPKDPKQQTESAANPCPPNTDNSNANETLSFPQMPCVSATGNGPNGKTINGLLYKYSQKEVTIVCVCHGTSFSPAGFVEHAGGIDITHPLKHITVIPSAF